MGSKRGMMLGKIVGMICGLRFPMDNEMELLEPIMDPVETHVYCFGQLHDSVIGYAIAIFLLVDMVVGG
jgi:hypothetical protein